MYIIFKGQRVESEKKKYKKRLTRNKIYIRSNKTERFESFLFKGKK